jgi:hypothetical protein
MKTSHGVTWWSYVLSSCNVSFVSDFNQIGMFRQILLKISNVKLHENTSGLKRCPLVGTYLRMGRHDEAVVVFRIWFGKPPAGRYQTSFFTNVTYTKANGEYVYVYVQTLHTALSTCVRAIL